MKKIVDYLGGKGFIYKEFKNFDKSLLNTRKKFFIYTGTDVKSNYHLVFSYEQKSRFLLKHAKELMNFSMSVSTLLNHNFRYKHLFLTGEICSKSSNYLKMNGWKIYHDIV